ncbi:olfactory receptor 5V1-like [Lissotriton helveticus]
MEGFVIVGFSDVPQIQVPLFVAFLLVYLMTVLGNLLILVTIASISHMHTPMYFFLTNLSFLDIVYTSSIFPKMLINFFTESRYISLTECLLQTYFFAFFMSTEFVLLAVMAYDRFVAICKPLRYMAIMNKAICTRLSALSWITGLLDPVPHTIMMSKLSFCASHAVNHFFCDITALMKLSCTSTRTVETMTYIFGTIVVLLPFILIITSYINILLAILKIRSTEGRHKTFSTCASHLTVVILFYGSVCSTYMRPTSTFSVEANKIFALSYIAVTPLCNPIIYSLKNQEFKTALAKAKNKILNLRPTTC